MLIKNNLRKFILSTLALFILTFLRKAKAERCIMIAAKLIAPVIEASFDEGFDWCADIVKGSAYQELANELEITRSIAYLKMKDFTKVGSVIILITASV